MAFIDSIKKRAKQNKKTIVLPETADMRTLEAAHKILQEGIADIILVGDKQTIIKKADGLDLTGAKFVDPYDCDKLNDYVSILVELRKKKGMTPEGTAFNKRPVFWLYHGKGRRCRWNGCRSSEFFCKCIACSIADLKDCTGYKAGICILLSCSTKL